MDTVLYKRIRDRSQQAENGCWIWSGAAKPGGYGNISAGGKYMNTHRAMWLAAVGEIPEGMRVCHSCDNKLCVNPSHLFLGSQRDNLHDMTTKGRRAAGASLSDKIRAGWTQQHRENRSRQMAEHLKNSRETKALSAGHPRTWRQCAKCLEWKPPEDMHQTRKRFYSYCRHCKRILDRA